MSTKNSSDIIGDRTLDLLNRSAVPQPTALRRNSAKHIMTYHNCIYKYNRLTEDELSASKHVEDIKKL
jgi:hypothetical protein